MKPLITQSVIRSLKEPLEIDINTPATANQKETGIVNYIFSRLIVLHPAWKNAVSGDTKRWGAKYREELFRVLIAKNIRTEEAIERGLAVAADQDSDFLPNPGRFAKWCKPITPHRSHQLFSDQKTLPRPPPTKGFASKQIAQMRRDFLE